MSVQLLIMIDELLSKSIINLDKPSGFTSREVTERVKKILNCKKAGHAGTLDSNVTGVLIVALNDAVKLMPLLMGLDKEYEGVMFLHRDIDLQTLVKTIEENFVGEITQTPPVKSSVARKPRVRIVYNFTILDKVDRVVAFKTKVQAGTYIRKLISDIGEKLSIGAQLRELRRTRVGHFSVADSVSIEQIEKKKNLKQILIPIEDAISHVTKVFVEDETIDKIIHGAPIKENDIYDVSDKFKLGDYVAIFSKENKFVAIGLVKNDENVFIKTDRII